MFRGAFPLSDADRSTSSGGCQQSSQPGGRLSIFCLFCFQYIVPKEGKGLITFAIPQTIDDPTGLLDDDDNGNFFFRRNDGTWAIVQAWPVNYDSAFRQEWEIYQYNPDPEIFKPQAAEEFRQACRAMFGADADSVPVLYCRRSAVNVSPVYVGNSEVG